MNQQPLENQSNTVSNTPFPNHAIKRAGILSLLMLSALLFTACLPRILGMQGRLLDSAGNPITADVDMVIKYWTCESGPDSDANCDIVYTQTKNNVAVTNGLFDLQIGPTNTNADVAPDPMFFARPLFAEITINGETLTPRQRLVGAPYAMSLVGGAVVASFHQGPGGTDGTDRNYATLSVVAGGKNGTALLVSTSSTAPGGDLIRGCSSPINLNNRDCGDLRFRVTGDGNVTADGAITGGGADFAEYLDATGNHALYEPGDVLVVSPDQDRAVTLADQPYSTAVIGVYSTDPAVMGGGRYLADDGTTDMLPVGIIGIVPVKVSAENGAIHRGDMLTTSGTPGYAMRATQFVPGAMLGKAMGELKSGTGVIEVVLLLQ